MGEFTPRRMAPWLWLGAGMAAAVLAGLGGVVAALAAVLAQVAYASGWHARRETEGSTLRGGLLPRLVLWTAMLGAFGALAAWPLRSLLQTRTLGAAVALSLLVGFALIVLWRHWPRWGRVERDGSGLRAAWRRPIDGQADWRGLLAAALATPVPVTVLLLAWPDLLTSGQRWGLAVACAVLWALLHAGLHRLAARLPRAEAASAVAGLPPLRNAEPVPLAEVPAAATLALVDMDPALDTKADEAAFSDLPEPQAPVDPDALYAAARTGRVDQVLQMLAAGADVLALPAAGDRDQRTLAALAAVLPDLRLLRELIVRGVDLNAAHGGLTPLLAATRDSWHGRPEAVMTLLANGADPRTASADGNTPLHHAARSTDPGVAALLLDATADLEAANLDGLTPLGVACAVGNWRMARFLLERGARPERAGITPALVAAASSDEDDPAGVQLLLRHKAGVNAADGAGRTALHAAAAAGHADIVDQLLAAGAQVDARDSAGRTPLLEAAYGGHAQVAERLAGAGADPRAVDEEGCTGLMLSVLSDSPSLPLVQRLLEWGVEPEQPDATGKRPGDLAAEAGRWALHAALQPRPQEPVAAEPPAPPDRAPLDLIRDALREFDIDRIDPAWPRLLRPGALDALLHEDALRTQANLDWLLRHGADPEARAPDGHTLLWVLLDQRGTAGSIRRLLDAGASPAGAGGLARFLAGRLTDPLAGTQESLALALLDRGADPFAGDGNGARALPLALRLGWDALIGRLLEAGVDPDAVDAHGMSALHVATALKRDAWVRELLLAGASPGLRAADGQTPLGIALAAGDRAMAAQLDWRLWPLPRRRLRPADLPAAATAGDTEAVARLLALGLSVEAVDRQGCSALLRAAGSGHLPVVELLLQRGADPAQRAATGATPLSAAISAGKTAITEHLIAHGADLEQRLPGQVTVLMLAAALGLPDMCARLLAAGADIHASDDQGLTPLHCAALYAFGAGERARVMALFDTLLLAGADANAAAQGGQLTPLLLLLGARAEPGTPAHEEIVLAALEPLLDEDVDLDARDPRGFGPLHLAALHGLLEVTRRLLRAGADPDLRDTLNRPPREIALMRGFVDVAAEFEPPPGSHPSIARFLRS